MEPLKTPIETNRRIEKERYLQTIAPIQPLTVDTQETKETNLQHSKSKRFVVIGITTISILFGIFIAMLFLFLTSIDLAFFKITLYGTVVDAESQLAIPNASISLLSGEQTTTNEDGIFTIGNLVPGKTEIEVSAEGFSAINEEISITRSFLNYSVNQKFELVSATRANITGKLVGFSRGYSFIDDTLQIGDETISINSDGSFRFQGELVGDVKLLFTSPNFKDIDRNITLRAGTNTIPDINLEPAGDIVDSLKSYITEEIVTDVTFQVEGVPQQNIKIDTEAGIFEIIDLVIDREYKLRVIANGFETRDYTITIKQGLNELFGFELVESGSTAFGMIPANENSFQIFYSDFDGKDLTQQTNLLNLNPSAIDYVPGNNFILYASEFERIRSNLGNYIRLIYSINPSTGIRQNVTTNTKDLGIVVPNFRAAKALNISRSALDFNTTNIEVMDLSGNNRKQLYSLANNDTVLNGIINDQGSIAAVTVSNAGQTKLIRIDINTGNTEIIAEQRNVELYSISPDGNRILFGSTNTSTTFLDLLMHDKQRSETRIIMTNSNGNNYQFKNNSNSEFFYWSTRAALTNIFAYNIETGTEQQISRLGSDVQIRRIYQQGAFLFYVTNNGLYVINPENPKNYKLVIEGEIF